MKKMKRFGLLLLMTCCMIALAACGSAEKGSTDAKQSSSLEAIKKDKNRFRCKNDTRLFGLKILVAGILKGLISISQKRSLKKCSVMKEKQNLKK